MRVLLTVTAGPHKGLEFSFDKHDTFLVGRSRHAHFRLPAKDKYFSRIHFMMEVNPPQCRLIDMGSQNGTYVNGEKVLAADLKDGDQIRAGQTSLRVKVERGSGLSTISFDEVKATAVPEIPGCVLERPLGRGAMGTTYLGRRTDAPAPLAIKVVQPSLQGTPAQIDTFLQSARFLIQLDHPHLVRLREVGMFRGGFYFVSNHVAGENAAQKIARDGPLPVRRAVRWINHILKALEYAHGKHFIHRDIKPTNVLIEEIDGKEEVRLGDFGLARVYQAAPFSGLAMTAETLNLASFMPPEVLFNFQEVNPLADQFSAAALLYYLLTGDGVQHMPSESQNRYSSLFRRQFQPIRERREDVPAALATAIHKALARTPQQRFPSVAEFRQTLLRAMR
jgi:serine/threonine-protein kinase